MNKTLLLSVLLLLSGFTQGQPKRIVTLSSAISSTVDALGLGRSIVAVDVTSLWPENIKSLPKVSRNRAVSAEGITSFHPEVVIAPADDLSRETLVQLTAVGIRVVNIRQDYSPSGAISFIRQVAAAVGQKEKGELLAKKTATALNSTLSLVKTAGTKGPKVLFIYARGTGTMSVAGKGSSLDAIIRLSGGRNAIQEFNDFKPYTTEALIKANPDLILMFDFGLSSLGGKDAVLRMPGVAFTSAGKNKAIVTMDGPLLVDFSTRLPEAIRELHQKLTTK